MKNVSRFVSCMLLVVISHVALAQTRPVSQALDFWITNTEKQVVSAADAMPEGKYSFAPTAGEFTGVRTFAEQVKHLSAANYQWQHAYWVRTHVMANMTRLHPIRSKARPRSWATSEDRSRSCIGLWLPSLKQMCWNPWTPLPAHGSVLSAPLTRWPTPTITTGRWWNTCA